MIAAILRPRASNLISLLLDCSRLTLESVENCGGRSCTEFLHVRFFILDLLYFVFASAWFSCRKMFNGKLLGVSRILCGCSHVLAICPRDSAGTSMFNIFILDAPAWNLCGIYPERISGVFEDSIQYGKNPGTFFHVILPKSPETMTFLGNSCRTYCSEPYILKEMTVKQ